MLHLIRCKLGAETVKSGRSRNADATNLHHLKQEMAA